MQIGKEHFSNGEPHLESSIENVSKNRMKSNNFGVKLSFCQLATIIIISLESLIENVSKTLRTLNNFGAKSFHQLVF